MTQWNFGYGLPQDELSEIKGAGWLAGDNLHAIKAGVDLTQDRLIQPPQTVTKKCSYNGAHLPVPADDGSLIVLPDDYSDNISMIDASGNLVWECVYTDVHANAGLWGGMLWYDNVDEALWVSALEGPNLHTVHLAKIPALTGAPITYVGSFQSWGTLSNFYHNNTHIERASHGSGDFTILYDGKEATVSSVNGSLLSGPTDITQGGVLLSTLIPCGYRSVDGAIVANNPAVVYGLGAMRIARGGSSAYFVHWDYRNAFGSGNTSAIIVWDDCVAISAGFTSSQTLYGPRFFVRSDFDRWLHDVADFLGLPA